jgi:hypothetical protein
MLNEPDNPGSTVWNYRSLDCPLIKGMYAIAIDNPDRAVNSCVTAHLHFKDTFIDNSTLGIARGCARVAALYS